MCALAEADDRKPPLRMMIMIEKNNVLLIDWIID